MSWIELLLGRFWQRVAVSTAPATGGLGLLRVLTGLYLLLIVAPYSYWVGEAPQTFFHPPKLSVMKLLPGFPPTAVMWTVDVVGLSLACLLMLGVYARVTTLAMVVVGVFSSNATMCFGKIDHDGLFWAYLACMAFSGWGQRLALAPDKPVDPDGPARAMALLGVCLGFAMSAVGVHKAVSWVDFDTSTGGFLGWFAGCYFVLGRRALLAHHMLALPPLGFELIDYAGVVFETSCFVMLLWGRRAWGLWLLVACVFHLINTLTLNIPFLQNLLPYWAFVDFSSAQTSLEKWWSKRAVRVGFAGVGVSFVLLHIGLRYAGVGGWLLFVYNDIRDNNVVLRTSLVFWVVGGLVLVSDLVERWRAPSPVPSDLVSPGS
jgi:hypothetical protein